MLSIAAASVGIFALLALVRYRLAAVLAASLILFGISYRIIDAAYLDLYGPIFSTELGKFVGGNGGTAYFVLSALCIIVPLAFMFRPKAVLANVELPLVRTGYGTAAEALGLGAVAMLVIVLYLDMLRIGIIPLFSGMDRLEYNGYAGLLHNPAYSLGFLPAAALGILTVLPRLRGEPYRYAAVIVFVTWLFYWVLTGNRFSAFLVAGTFYALPFAAIVMVRRSHILPRRNAVDPWAALVSAKIIVPIIGIAAILGVSGLLMNSYYNIRGYADPVFEMSQRVFVQPVQIFASRWELAMQGRRDALNWQAIDEVLVNPLNPSGNTSIRYLMVEEVGYFRTVELQDQGTQFAGGYPEIFLELFGLQFSLPLMLLCGIIAAYLARLAVRNILMGLPLSAVMSVYVYFAFNLTYVGGMLNSLIAWSLAVKVFALLVIWLFEKSVVKNSRNVAAAAGSSRFPNQQRWGVPTA